MHAHKAVVVSDSRECMSFGPFRLIPGARALEKNGRLLALGNRALDILIVLVEHAGEVVSQRELLTRVWRGLIVCPSNLRVHMNALRRVLDDPAGEARYIANVTGQGYCFVAPVERRGEADRTVRNPAVDLTTCFNDLGALIEHLQAMRTRLVLDHRERKIFEPSCARQTSRRPLIQDGRDLQVEDEATL